MRNYHPYDELSFPQLSSDGMTLSQDNNLTLQVRAGSYSPKNGYTLLVQSFSPSHPSFLPVIPVFLQ
ncbi:hypothetical protein Ldro_1338 [Legionella drozanskii LLAP-1]|uniref:Uncharacterized protein n=1 Tax=Legionella drozanskii LLAP-1 TaxID=1212489 RepID=A0A0W0SWI1_9GAMM|nr:hypothetical protein Ldro_1338 [Legionella drozanskii LLAP-1]